MFFAQDLSIAIDCSPVQVYEFVSKPENRPKWAAALSTSVKKINDERVGESATLGTVKIDYLVQHNQFGVQDHEFELASGVQVYVPMRVFANNGGSEVVLTVYRLPDMSDQQFVGIEKGVMKDLRSL